MLWTIFKTCLVCVTTNIIALIKKVSTPSLIPEVKKTKKEKPEAQSFFFLHSLSLPIVANKLCFPSATNSTRSGWPNIHLAVKFEAQN